MRITKFEHACFAVERDNHRVVVDPGSYTTPLLDLRDVVAIVITHEHADHWTPDQLRRILDLNPTARLFAPAGVIAAARKAAAAADDAASNAGAGFEFTEVADGAVHEVGPFVLTFYGAKHAVIHSSIPVVDNVGVLINETIFYPGDAYTVPPVAIDVLAVPSSAPWLKIGEAMDYVLAVAPKRAFATHEMVNSVIGKGMATARIRWATEQGGGEFFPLEPGESLDL
ncbi:L-ascorbate metabolism protein UlaG (beta-lactamase superfamily) [Glaciihabitans tibetensis]|uniref:L-ascorbate metabolism protein UlaG (Beta-lactamase superfamily) n=1 Tax=Glaciihabitans tibetensis TaxID=1266600 RepID=A0A2T0VG28_9MICO|nr:MBL fold metallo-hydrolase [Glaciihabitans tibetensis]PRY69155.1 L-ascorbate metabolism protein UlaG (beta-lactamase superfamily) [Glaciihabitans tibetensis]